MPVSTRSRTRGPLSTPHYVYNDQEESMDASVESKPVVENRPRVLKRDLSSSSDDESWSGDDSAIENRNERMRLRPWLEKQINSGKCTGLEWIDKKNKIVRIPWKHASRHGWRLGDACLFQRWAIHSGKFRTGMKPNPKRWKANFRCALNSLADIKEVKEYSQKRGHDAFKVYQLLPSDKKGQEITCKIKRPKVEKPALSECDVNLLPLTIMDLEKKMHEEEKNDKKDMKKKAKRKQSKVYGHRKINKEEDDDDQDDDDQEVPDVQFEHRFDGLPDHDSYTLSKHSGGQKVKGESELESCNGGYKFNGSPTSDWRMNMNRVCSYETSACAPNEWNEDEGDDSDVPTEEQVINEVIEMEKSCSDDSFTSQYFSQSPSSICDWITEDLPQTTCQWNEDLMKSPSPFLNGYADDFNLPCIAQPVHGSLTEVEERQLEWQPAGLKYQDL